VTQATPAPSSSDPAGSIEDDFLFSVALTPEYRDDPYPLLAALRAEDPVYHSPLGPWLLTRHADVSAVVRDPRLSNDERHSDLHRAHLEARAAAGLGEVGVDDEFNRVMLFLDPPDHTRIRGLVNAQGRRAPPTPRPCDRRGAPRRGRTAR
jgi:cytochrome P450